jgi:uncharacterized membrane protein
MKSLGSGLRRETLFPLLALLLSSATSVAFVGLKIAWTGRGSNLGLVWNLFLAWVPLFFALVVIDLDRRGTRGGWRLYSSAFGWLIFFPNAPYILTDLIHLRSRQPAHYWVDMVLILLFAWTGFLLGFWSLYLMQSVVARRAGKAAGWLFIVLMAGLGGLGVYIGRFLRWNSWDIFVNPLGVLRDVAQLAADPIANRTSILLAVLFAVFMLMAYLMLHALTHLQPARDKLIEREPAQPG